MDAAEALRLRPSTREQAHFAPPAADEVSARLGTRPLGRKTIVADQHDAEARGACNPEKVGEPPAAARSAGPPPPPHPKVDAMPPSTTIVTNSIDRRNPASAGVTKRFRHARTASRRPTGEDRGNHEHHRLVACRVDPRGRGGDLRTAMQRAQRAPHARVDQVARQPDGNQQHEAARRSSTRSSMRGDAPVAEATARARACRPARRSAQISRLMMIEDDDAETQRGHRQIMALEAQDRARHRKGDQARCTAAAPISMAIATKPLHVRSGTVRIAEA